MMAEDKKTLVADIERNESFPRYVSESNIQEAGGAAAGPGKDQGITVYRSRWYIVLVFSYVTIMQNIVWNTFSPISGPATRVYQWDGDWQIPFTNNLAPAAFLLSVIPFSYLMDKKGLRPAVVITAVLIFVGSGIRCFTFEPSGLTSSIVFIGHFLNGLASTVILSAPPLVSAQWFPSNERTTATSIGSQLGFAGLATSFLFGPYMVPDTKYEADFYKNHTAHCTPGKGNYMFTEKNVTYCANVDDERRDMSYFMYTQTGMSALCCLLVLVYFPNRPPTPPSITAGLERLDYKSGLRQLLRARQFWWLVLAYGITTGIFFGWVSVLDVDLDPLGVSQTDAGWIGFLMQLIPSFVAVGVAWMIDYFGGYIKKYAIILIIISVSIFFAFLLVVLKVIPYNLPLVYSLLIIGAVFFQPVIPIFYEMGVESAYPVHEGVSAGVLQLCPQTMALLFLGIFFIPDIGKTWMNYVVVSTFVATVPILLIFKETRKRSAVDKHEDEEEE